MPVLLETLDQKIAATLSDWNLYTTLIAVSIVAFLAYPIVYPSEPDTHPLLLARQASAVRSFSCSPRHASTIRVLQHNVLLQL